MSSDRSVQASIYDDFHDYVTNKLKDKHPHITLKEFCQIQVGMTHLIIPLQHVQTGVTKDFFDIIEKYKPNTFVKTKEDETTGAAIFVAHVPWKTKIQEQPMSYPSMPMRSKEPNSMLPIVYLFLAMVLLLLAVGKTNKADWVFITKIFF